LATSPAPLIGESAADYEALHARVAALVRPRDIIEEILVGETVDLVGRRPLAAVARTSHRVLQA
jgi:hypothetical protein